MLNSLEAILKNVKNEERRTVAVAAAADREIMEVVREAETDGLANFILIGDEKEIREYKVDQLKFRPKKRREKQSTNDAELKKLEALEKKEGKSKLNDN